MTDSITMLSNATVGDAEYSLLILFLYLRQSTQPIALNLPYIFSTKNIKENSDSTISYFFILIESIGMKVSILCSCVNSFVTDLSPLSLNSFKPVLNFYCCVKPFQLYICIPLLLTLE